MQCPLFIGDSTSTGVLLHGQVSDQKLVKPSMAGVLYSEGRGSISHLLYHCKSLLMDKSDVRGSRSTDDTPSIIS